MFVIRHQTAFTKDGSFAPGFLHAPSESWRQDPKEATAYPSEGRAKADAHALPGAEVVPLIDAEKAPEVEPTVKMPTGSRPPAELEQEAKAKAAAKAAASKKASAKAPAKPADDA